MSKTPSCYYYDEQYNLCKCYSNENLNELLAENAKLRDALKRYICQAYMQACDKGNPITVGIIEEDMRELGIGGGLDWIRSS